MKEMEMMMKIVSFLLVFLLALPLAAAPPQGKSVGSRISLTVDNDNFIDANRMLMFVTNHGNFGRDLAGVFGNDYGTYYPYSGDTADIAHNINDAANHSPNYATGLWVGGIDSATSEVRVAVSEYASEYVPGPMEGGTFMADQPAFRVYKLYADSLAGNPNADYTNWPSGSPQNAPVTPGGEPAIIGDQFLWSVFNDADASGHTGVDGGETAPLGIEVRQSVWAFDREDPLGDVAFFRWRIFNEGGNTIQNCYISIWCDPDVGNSTDDLVGCDTTLALGFAYNNTLDDQQYDDMLASNLGPPATGIDFFQGPLVYNEFGGGRMWDQVYPDSANMGMTSFNKYINGTDPDNFGETYAFMRGLTKTGGPYIYQGDTLKFVTSGDPVSGQGDVDFAAADRRFMMTTGPITFRPGDSTEIVAAIIIGQATTHKTSIALMRFYDRFAQLAYDSNFVLPEAPAKPVVTVGEEPGAVSLWWTDTSEVDPGSYPFEGYTVWQGESSTGPWHQVDNFDIFNTLEDVFDEKFDPVSGVPEIRLVKNGTNLGIKRHIVIDEDVIIGGPLRDVTTYYFKVDAYAVSLDAALGLRTLTSSTTMSATPQRPVADIEFPTYGGEMLEVSHAAGPSTGAVTVSVVNPLELTGHNYQVVCEDTVGIVIDTIINPAPPFDTSYVSIDIAWHLEDVTAGVRVLEWEPRQLGGNEKITDGFVVKVSGPPSPGVQPGSDGWAIPQGTRRFTWASSGGFGWEGFNGAIGWGGPGDTHGFGVHDPVPASELINVRLILATADTLGVFDPADENVSYAYRYGRGFGAPPAQPEFAPYIVDPDPPGGSYGFQDFELSCPLSAWDVSADPPERLAVGYLENNAEFATLDGKYWPRNYEDYADSVLAANGVSATSGNGPREWLWIFKAPYSETPVPEYQLNAINDPMPIMYWLTVSRRGEVPFSPDSTGQDQFDIIPGVLNTTLDTFSFVAPSPVTVAKTESALDRIRVVPNPFYLFGAYDPSIGQPAIKFSNLPTKCTITIYNLGGDLIRSLYKNDATTAIVTWDALTEEGLPVASGIYLYVVDAPNFGQKMGKMAVFTEAELLDIY
jgi:hypothetical protein